MSEAILKALMQLFALVSDIHDDSVITNRERNVVRIFLLRHLNNELASRYMKMYKDYLAMFNSDQITKGSIRDRKRISLNAMRILSVCEQINSELELKQKVYVFVKLTDYISHADRITETELDFLQTVAASFGIPSDEYTNITCLIMDPVPDKFSPGRLLVMGREEEAGNGIKKMHIENMHGQMLVLHVPLINGYLLRYKRQGFLYLNGQEIHDNETYFLDKGSSIRGEGIKPVFFSEIANIFSQSPPGTNVNLEARNISFSFRNSANGVHALNFSVKSGELTGIIGGSGVGKSTTLSVLNGTLKPHNGTILVNGYDLYNESDRNKLGGIIGFVPQDDLLIEELTVYQNLYYNARMCLSNLPPKKLDEAVEKIMADLDLTSARDLKVGNPLSKVISGGQRKRINIALELMREPAILFVDEPTSGLSSVDSEMVMNLLKDLTYKGKLVVINIHQPSSDIYKMFDKLMVIDRGGYQIFFGNPSEAIVYFRVQTNHANPDEDQCIKCGNVDTEQLLRMIEAKVVDEHGQATRTRRVTPAEWAERFRAFSANKESLPFPAKSDLPYSRYRIPGLFEQSVVFLLRDLRSKLADRQYLAISLLGPPLLALLLSYFTRSPGGSAYSFNENENLPAYIFMCVITSLFFGLMTSSEEIVSDRKILKRESFLNLSWFSYLNSKILIMFILSAIQTFLFVVIGNGVLEIRGMTFVYWFALFTTSCTGNIIGLNLSSAFRSVLTIYILIPFIIIPQLLFSGVLVRYDSLNIKQHEYVPFIGDLMIARWSFEAIATEQFRNNEYERKFFENDVVIANNTWNGILIDLLSNDLKECSVLLDASDYDAARLKFRRLKYHLEGLQKLSGVYVPVSLTDSLSEDKFSRSEANHLQQLLDSVKSVFMQNLKLTMKLNDKIVAGSGNLQDIYMRNVNKKLTSLMLGEEVLAKYFETSRKYIRNFRPGLMKATSGNGRAHFLSPVKTVGSMETGTFLFNMLIVWTSVVALYLILLFRLPERLSSAFEKVRLRKAE